MTFKPGDVVRLASSNTLMTVERLDERNGQVKCVWFDSQERLQLSGFPPETLVPVHSDKDQKQK